MADKVSYDDVLQTYSLSAHLESLTCLHRGLARYIVLRMELMSMEIRDILCLPFPSQVEAPPEAIIICLCHELTGHSQG